MHEFDGHKIIDKFEGEYYFLSNFYPARVTYNGRTYLNSEAAFHAQKDPSRADEFINLDPSAAKRLGRSVKINVEEWNSIRFHTMLDILYKKFEQNPDLKQKLIDTGDALLVEGNTWGDTYWGMCNGKGQNCLGIALTFVRCSLANRSTVEDIGILTDYVGYCSICELYEEDGTPCD